MQTPIPPHQAIELLQKSGVGVMPTDTVYGLVARAHDPQAVARLYRLKNREHKPGTLIAASVEQLEALGAPTPSLAQVKAWWPGAISIVLPVTKPFAYLHQGLGDVAMRVVAPQWLQELLTQTGPLLTSSANQPGQPSSTTVTEAYNHFGESVDFYVDGGTLSHISSTVVKPHSHGALEVLRQGQVKL